MDAKFWLDVVQWVFTLGMMAVVWLDRGRKDNKVRMDAFERRLITAEEHLRHAPTHDDIAKLREQYSGLESKLDRVTNTLDRIHDYLMNSKA